MGEKPLNLDFVQFEVIYKRQKNSNKWTRKIKRIADPIKTDKDIKGIVISHTSLHEGETIEDEKRFTYKVNVPCDPRLNDPNTLMIPEYWQPFEEDAFKITDKAFKERHPEAEIIPISA